MTAPQPDSAGVILARGTKHQHREGLGTCSPLPLLGQQGLGPCPARADDYYGRAAGTNLCAPSQALTQLLKCEQHFPAQEQAKKEPPDLLRDLLEQSLGKAPACRQTGLGNAFADVRRCFAAVASASASRCQCPGHYCVQNVENFKEYSNAFLLPTVLPSTVPQMKPFLHLQA